MGKKLGSRRTVLSSSESENDFPYNKRRKNPCKKTVLKEDSLLMEKIDKRGFYLKIM